MLFNDSAYRFEIENGMRIAQLVFMPILRPLFIEVDEFTVATERGDGGFGHTGVN